MPLFGSYLNKLMETTPDLAIPLWQVLVYVLVICVAALYERHRLILIFSYFFMLYWVFIQNVELLSLSVIWVLAGVIFGVFGLVAVIVTVYQMLTQER